ncbi:MAG: hypothetical protein GC159_01695 [Phycisphaera sp.]|nr:hypothetical protein [Phycisphaera sp.]
MLFLVLDFGVLWLLLNMMTDENWDDRKGQMISIVAIISIGGGFLTRITAAYLGFMSLGIYFVVGFGALAAIGSLTPRISAMIMGAFMAYKIGTVLLLYSMFT